MSDGRRAYVTLVTNADYAIGAAALVRSLRLSQTEAAIVVLHTEAVGAASGAAQHLKHRDQFFNDILTHF